MDFEATLETIETIAASIPEDLEAAISTVTSFLPSRTAIEGVFSDVVSLIPSELDFFTMIHFLLLFGAGSLFLGILGRLFLGKQSSLNHALSSVMGILFIYAVTIVAYTFQHENLSRFLSPLPFVTFSGDYLVVFPLQNAQITSICHEVLSMVILAFLVNLIDTCMPKGKTFVGWCLLRFFSIILSMLLHLLVRWAFNTYLPEFLVIYAPTILLFLLIGLFLIGLVNLVLGLVLTVVNPFFGAVYTFFFSNIIGKQLSKAVFSTMILCSIFFLLTFFGYTILNISMASLAAYVPLGIISLILWYFIGHVL